MCHDWLIVDWLGNNHLTLKGKRGNGVLFFKNYVTTFNRTTNFLEDAKTNNIVMWLNVNLSKPT
jgi:hypothetical protein